MKTRRASMVRTRLTGRGYLFVGISIALYFSALTSQSGLLLLLIGLAVGCGILNALMSRRMIRALKVAAPSDVQLPEGGKFSEPWQVTNPLKRDAHLITILQGKLPLLKIRSAPAGGKVSAAPALQFAKRGVYPLAEVEVASSYPFGLALSRRKVQLEGEVVVHPAVYPAPVVPASGHDLMLGGKHKGRRHSMSGATFAGVRPVQPGDPLRNIHWRSSSKGLGLMVRFFEEELSGRITFLVDAGSKPDRLDDCLRAAGSLMFAALDEGHHIEWMDLGINEHHSVPPFADGSELLDQLARVEANPRSLESARVIEALEKIGRSTSVCFVVTEVTESVRAAADRLVAQRRIVSFCVPAQSKERLGVGRVFQYSASSITEVA